MDLLASAAEQGRAKQSELVVESFFLHSYGKSKRRKISEAIIFSILLSEQKKFFFFFYDRIIDIRDESARPIPTRP